jgi:hypothetical protein
MSGGARQSQSEIGYSRTSLGAFSVSPAPPDPLQSLPAYESVFRSTAIRKIDPETARGLGLPGLLIVQAGKTL